MKKILLAALIINSNIAHSVVDLNSVDINKILGKYFDRNWELVNHGRIKQWGYYEGFLKSRIFQYACPFIDGDKMTIEYNYDYKTGETIYVLTINTEAKMDYVHSDGQPAVFAGRTDLKISYRGNDEDFNFAAFLYKELEKAYDHQK